MKLFYLKNLSLSFYKFNKNSQNGIKILYFSLSATSRGGRVVGEGDCAQDHVVTNLSFIGSSWTILLQLPLARCLGLIEEEVLFDLVMVVCC